MPKKIDACQKIFDPHQKRLTHGPKKAQHPRYPCHPRWRTTHAF